jgi:hypothetical protein
MGGRGASSSIAKAGALGSGATLPPQADTTVQIDNTQVASAFSASYDAFMAMSDDDKADFISTNIKSGVPDHLADNSFQRFLYNSQITDKPDIVDDATLDTMTGTEIFRTVNYVDKKYNPAGIGYTAPQIANQVMKGTDTRVSDTGGSVYGRGIYFADSYSHSTSMYGNTTGNVKATAVMRAKLNNNAKVISSTKAKFGARQEIASGSKLGKALARCDSDSQASIYAMSKGFNVISSGHGYFNILNRNAMTMSKDVKAKGSSWN